MEGAALAALAAMLGHRAVTVCDIIAGRTDGTADTKYSDGMMPLLEKVMERI